MSSNAVESGTASACKSSSPQDENSAMHFAEPGRVGRHSATSPESPRYQQLQDGEEVADSRDGAFAGLAVPDPTDPRNRPAV
jgi:hypothetical protein